MQVGQRCERSYQKTSRHDQHQRQCQLRDHEAAGGGCAAVGHRAALFQHINRRDPRRSQRRRNAKEQRRSERHHRRERKHVPVGGHIEKEPGTPEGDAARGQHTLCRELRHEKTATQRGDEDFANRAANSHDKALRQKLSEKPPPRTTDRHAYAHL